jgi:hypothetical protein
MNSSGPALARGQGSGDSRQEFSPLAHLLHELNQPLTGLQCSLELASAGPRTAEQYLRAIREGLELIGRIRSLVEGLREVADLAQEPLSEPEAIRLDDLVRETAADLRPVAESRAIRMEFMELEENPFAGSCTVRSRVNSAVFRLLESALSLAAADSVFTIHLNSQPQSATIDICWTEAHGAPARSSLSPPELGLLMARAAWQRAGGEWESEISATNRSVTIRLPWAATDNALPAAVSGDPS